MPRAAERIRTAGECQLERRADGGRRLVGYGAVFYRADDPGTEYRLYRGVVERIAPGAFKTAIASGDARALFNHNPTALLGRLSKGTLRLSEDRRGLRYEIDVPDTSAGRDVLELVERGDVDGSSFGFNVIAERWTAADDLEVRTLLEVELIDVGPVTFPAYSSTSAEAASGDRYGLEEAKRRHDLFIQQRNERQERAAAVA